MEKLIKILFGFLFLSLVAGGQIVPGSSGHGAPTFNCAGNDTYKDVDSGLVWQCVNPPTGWIPIPQFMPWGGTQASNGLVKMPEIIVGIAAVTALQTVRGIVAASYGPSTSNGATYMDVFPFGYSPWGSAITFEDYATGATGTAAAITLGLADDTNDSQRICMVAQRAATFDSFFCLLSHGGQLTWQATGDSLVLGGQTASTDAEFGFGARVGNDFTNKNAVLSGGGSVFGAGSGVGLAGNSGTFAANYFFYCDPNGNCGVGAQKTNATLDNWFVTPAGAETTVSIKVGTGTVLTRYSRYNGVFNPASVAANTCAAQSFTVTGVVVGDILIAANKPTEQAGLSVTPGHVTGTNAATMNFCNNTASPITPTAAETYNLVVVQ